MTPAEQRPPTERQLAIHAFMVAFRDQHSMWPTVREIGDAFGIKSTNAVSDHLRALKNKGLARQRVGCARGWIAVEQEQPA